MNWIFGDNINTDLITPGRFNITTDSKELAKVVFIEHRPEFVKQVKKGDIIIAGNNFGCGSSRETAPMALYACGINIIIARSFGRIFYRNAMNQGIMVIMAETKDITEQDKIILDIENQLIIINPSTDGKKIKAVIPPLVTKLHASGGMVAYLKKNGLRSIERLFDSPLSFLRKRESNK